jgi:cation diffusion facilitator CzcD-associated flavoprotein CzcO
VVSVEPEAQAIVIGAGAAGLSAAAMLAERGLRPLVLERDSIASSWRRRYDRLHLHTYRLFSGLPGYRLSSSRGPWVARDGVVDYLEGYARHHGVEVRTGVEVGRVEHAPGGWRVKTADETLEARFVVVATGYEHTPLLPDWPGLDSFEGHIVHGSEYRNPEPYAGRDVLVVGTGNTGAEVVVDLDEGGAGELMLSVRTPPQIFLRDANGIPSQVGSMMLHRLPPVLGDPLSRLMQRATVGDLTPYGMPRPERGVLSDFRDRDQVPILDVGLIRLLKQGRVKVVPAVESFDGPRVWLRGGESVEPDAVIAATGYRKGLEPLVGHLGVLDESGSPRHSGGEEDPSAPGLHFIGYINPLSGRLWSIRSESRRIADAVASSREGIPA